LILFALKFAMHTRYNFLSMWQTRLQT